MNSVQAYLKLIFSWKTFQNLKQRCFIFFSRFTFAYYNDLSKIFDHDQMRVNTSQNVVLVWATGGRCIPTQLEFQDSHSRKGLSRHRNNVAIWICYVAAFNLQNSIFIGNKSNIFHFYCISSCPRSSLIYLTSNFWYSAAHTPAGFSTQDYFGLSFSIFKMAPTAGSCPSLSPRSGLRVETRESPSSSWLSCTSPAASPSKTADSLKRTSSFNTRARRSVFFFSPDVRKTDVLTYQHLIHDDPQGPPVAQLIVARLQEDFGGDVVRRAHCGISLIE